MAQVEVRDDGLYEFLCDLGHKTVTKVQEQPFEILFEIGAHAIVDGYYREAVSSFAASLERFYEFAVKALTLHQGCDASYFDKLWSPLRSSSERQLGAFVAIWSHVYSEVPVLLPEKGMGREFRNNVIHKGKIPTRSESVAFGQCVMDLLDPQLAKLKNTAGEAVHKIVLERLQGMKAERAGTMSIAPTISIANAGGGTQTLEPHLKLIKHLRDSMPTNPIVIPPNERPTG